MATNYPSGTDSLTNPAGTSLLTSPDHAGQHTNINDAMEAVQTTAGTTAGTNVLKHFAAGDFPVRATGVAAKGTLQQTIVGGTLGTNVLLAPTGTVNLQVGTIGTINSNLGTIGTINNTLGTFGTVVAGTYTKVNSIPGSALSTNAILLAYQQTSLGTTTAAGTNAAVAIGSLSGTVTMPSGGRYIKLTAYARTLSQNVGSAYAVWSIWKGPVNTGTLLTHSFFQAVLATGVPQMTCITVGIDTTPPAGLGTYNVGLATIGGGTATLSPSAGAGENSFLLVEAL